MSNKLVEYLNLCSRAYYAGSPIISDEVFDRLAEAADYAAIGAKQHDHLEKHYFPMWSLQKYYEGEGKRPQLPGYVDYSPKLDGAAISILYIDGLLVRVLTRGDGTEGTIITDKFTSTRLVPHTIPVMGVVQITGEIVAPKTVENSRNYASGSLNLKDVAEFKTRAVSFFAYGIQPAMSDTFVEDMALLSEWGFGTVKDAEIEKIYPCDGLVYRVNNNAAFYAEGYTSKHPKGAYALKERGEAVETTLLAVEWQTGKSGKVTPVAILESVYVGDALVSRATLNNIAFIRALDLRVGDTVGVARAGEIIPQITHKVG